MNPFTSVINAIIGGEAAREQDEKTQAAKKLFSLGGHGFSDEDLKAFYAMDPERIEGKQVEIDPELRRKQMAALEALQAISDGRIESQGAAQRQAARMQAEQIAAGRDAAIQQQMSSRGVGGSGMEFALRGQSGQQAANMAGQMGMQGAAQSALERLQSQNAYQSGLGNLRAQDTDLAMRNSDIINRFNQYNADRQNAANMYNTNLQNQLGQFNLNRKDRNKVYDKESAFKNASALAGLLPAEKSDVGQKYQVMMNLSNEYGQMLEQMAAAGAGGSFGGDIGGAMGGQMGSQMGSQAGAQMAQQMMQPRQQQGGYNQPVPQWGYMNPNMMYSSGGYV